MFERKEGLEVTIVASDTQIMRGINAAAIIAALRNTGATSVARLANSVGLSRQAVTRSLSGLQAAGLVTISGPTPTAVRAGRPPQLVEFNSTAGYTLAVSLRPGHLRTAAGDLKGSLLAQRDVAADLSTEISAALEEAVHTQLRAVGASTDDVWATVVSVPGIVDPGTGIVTLSASMPELQGLNLGSELRRHLRCDVFVDNEVKLATEGERWRAPTSELSSMVLVEWGERIGAGLVLNGSLYRGVSNDSGDLGFLDLQMGAHDAPQTPGSLGPFELATGAAAVVREAREKAEANGDHRFVTSLDSATPAEGLDLVIDACLAGEAHASEAMRVAAARFARGIAAFRALLDPEVLVIGGQMARCGQHLLDLLNAELADERLNQPRLALSRLGRDAVIHGALHHGLELVDQTRLSAAALSSTPVKVSS